MFRILGIALLLTALHTAPAAAQSASGQAYAPDNIGLLTERDQIRVISREYSDQTGGREIPDDQLEFYLDQIDSSEWSFSRIKQDIATSLRRAPGYPGNGQGNGYGYGHGNDKGPGRVILCESKDKRPRQCVTNFRGPAVLTRKLSRTECTEGRTWGQRPGLVWVNEGCRGEFAEVRGGGSWEDSEYGKYSVTCASVSERHTKCAWNGRYGRPRLVERFSRSACEEGRGWGFRDGSLWVDGGCRARFEPDYSGYGY